MPCDLTYNNPHYCVAQKASQPHALKSEFRLYRTTHPSTALIIATLFANAAYGDHSAYIDEIVVTGALIKLDKSTTIQAREHSATDSAKLLPTIPGANVNSNGVVTGIAQYRGLYGDRVSVHLDHSPILTGGPNAMDAPLSYTPPLLLENITISRGVVSVSSAQESIGGHMGANLNRGQFGQDSDFNLAGGLFSRYHSVNEGFNHAISGQLANQAHKFSLLASYDEGDDTDAADKTISGSEFKRARYDLSYAYRWDNSEIELFVGQLDTADTGTPALPMDIDFIESDMAGVSLKTLWGDVQIDSRFAYGHVDHGMNNFAMRRPASPMQFRATRAVGRNWSYSLQAQMPISQGSLKLGADINETLHDANITNPNSAAFLIRNFNRSERNTYGLFAEWETDFGDWQLETGVRYNRVEMDSDETSFSGMMGMMAMHATQLNNRFNSADRDQQHDNIDLVFKLSKPLNDHLVTHLGLARKTRAPSYQESYLWLPLAAAGGLADGRSYTGNLDLDSEVAYELNLGLSWQSESAYFTPEFFYREFKDYIQGTPSADMTANMLSNMMSGLPALQFNNIDAQMIGFDAAWGYRINDSWRLDGVLSYVRGKRDDASDNLYRVAPLNHRLTLSYEQERWGAQLESVLYAKQSKVSRFNAEQKTAGYGLINLSGYYHVTPNLELGMGVENLLDHSYRDHLAGYNRNNLSELAVGERLYGWGRNLFVEAKFIW